jgi:hypothetical protein
MVLVLNAEDGQVVDGDAGGQSPPEGAVFGMEALAKWALPSDALVFAEGPKGPAKGGVDRPGGSGGSGKSNPAAFGGVEAMASGLPSGLSRGKKGSTGPSVAGRGDDGEWLRRSITIQWAAEEEGQTGDGGGGTGRNLQPEEHMAGVARALEEDGVGHLHVDS